MKHSLTADNWADAALDAIANGGVDAVAVEPIARALGVTKGSFYWHFQNRQALLQAAIARWEAQETDSIIDAVNAYADPRKRFQQVFRLINSSARSGRLSGAFAAASSDPVVGPAVERVAQKRLRFLEDCYTALGVPAEEARRWAMFAYATYMGTLQLRRDDRSALPRGRALNEYARLCMETLIPSPEKLAGEAGAESPAPLSAD